jgi:hypothetical protein
MGGQSGNLGEFLFDSRFIIVAHQRRYVAVKHGVSAIFRCIARTLFNCLEKPMDNLPHESHVALPAGWSVERHRHAVRPDSTGQDALETFVLRSPSNRSAAFYNIDGENGLVWELLRAVTDGKQGEPVRDNLPSSHVKEPYAMVVDRRYDGSGVSFAVHDGLSYVFSDGDCFDRKGDTLDGYKAQFLSTIALERLLNVAIDASRPKRADELAALTAQLCHALRRADPSNPLPDQAIKTLHRIYPLVVSPESGS